MSTKVGTKFSTKSSGRSVTKPPGKARANRAQQRRRFYIFAGLLGVLTVTSGLLVAMSPAPLNPDSAAAMATDRGDLAIPGLKASPAFADVAGVLETHVPVAQGRWEYIYVHHAGPGAPTPDPTNSPDHFVIDGADGQIRMTLRWSNQASASPAPGVSSIHPRCISILLTGDLDQTPPTPAQVRRCTELVRTLQKALQVPDKNVLLMDHPGSAAGTGRLFPTAALRQNLRTGITR